MALARFRHGQAPATKSTNSMSIRGDNAFSTKYLHNRTSAAAHVAIRLSNTTVWEAYKSAQTTAAARIDGSRRTNSSSPKDRAASAESHQ